MDSHADPPAADKRSHDPDLVTTENLGHQLARGPAAKSLLVRVTFARGRSTSIVLEDPAQPLNRKLRSARAAAVRRSGRSQLAR